MANLTVYLLASSNLKCVDRHLVYPEKVRGQLVWCLVPTLRLFRRVARCVRRRAGQALPLSRTRRAAGSVEGQHVVVPGAKQGQVWVKTSVRKLGI